MDKRVVKKWKKEKSNSSLTTCINSQIVLEKNTKINCDLERWQTYFICLFSHYPLTMQSTLLFLLSRDVQTGEGKERVRKKGSKRLPQRIASKGLFHRLPIRYTHSKCSRLLEAIYGTLRHSFIQIPKNQTYLQVKLSRCYKSRIIYSY